MLFFFFFFPESSAYRGTHQPGVCPSASQRSLAPVAGYAGYSEARGAPAAPNPATLAGVVLMVSVRPRTSHGQVARGRSRPRRLDGLCAAAVLTRSARQGALWPEPSRWSPRGRGPRAAWSPGGALAGAGDSECAARPRPPYWMPQPPRLALPPVSSLFAAASRNPGGRAVTQDPVGGRGRRQG